MNKRKWQRFQSLKSKKMMMIAGLIKIINKIKMIKSKYKIEILYKFLLLDKLATKIW